MLTAKDIISDILFYLRDLGRKKWILVAVAVLFAVGYSIQIKRKPAEYQATKTFMVSEDEGGNNGLSAVLGQFGLSGTGGGNYNYNKIMQIGLSNLILDQVLFEKADYNGKNDYIANHIIDEYDMHSDWSKDTSLRDFRFTPSNLEHPVAKRVRKSLEGKVRGDRSKANSPRLVDIFLNQESTIMSMNAFTTDPKLSIIISEVWYDKLSDFYIRKSIERQQKTFDQLEQKADSLYQLMSQSEQRLARSSDVSWGMVSQVDLLPQSRALRDIQMYGEMYSQVIKNKETAEFMLNSQTPFFQTIDSPSLPLYNNNKFRILNMILAMFIGLIVAVVILVLIAYYKKEIRPLLDNDA